MLCECVCALSTSFGSLIHQRKNTIPPPFMTLQSQSPPFSLSYLTMTIVLTLKYSSIPLLFFLSLCSPFSLFPSILSLLPQLAPPPLFHRSLSSSERTKPFKRLYCQNVNMEHEQRLTSQTATEGLRVCVCVCVCGPSLRSRGQSLYTKNKGRIHTD